MEVVSHCDSVYKVQRRGYKTLKAKLKKKGGGGKSWGLCTTRQLTIKHYSYFLSWQLKKTLEWCLGNFTILEDK